MAADQTGSNRDKPITAPIGPTAAMGRMLPVSRPAENDSNGLGWVSGLIFR